MFLKLLWIAWFLFIFFSRRMVEARRLNIHADHAVTVSKHHGNDSKECLKNISKPCQTLHYVLRAVQGQNSTVVYVEPGEYDLNSSFAFWNIKQFGIVGMSLNPQEVMVNCHSFAGLSFIFSKDIIFENVTFSSCGALQNSTSRGNPKFLTGLFFVNCMNLTMDGVVVKDGPGLGMQLYDVTGAVKISNSLFRGNGNKTVIHHTKNTTELVNSGGGLYFEYTYSGGLWPFETSPDPVYQTNSTFHFYNSTFEENIAPEPKINDSVIVPHGKDHVAFGRGGGVSFFFKGNATSNIIQFDSCNFSGNHALYGGGFFVEFQDSAGGNSVMYTHSSFYQNIAKYGGGGIRIGLIVMIQSLLVPNIAKFEFCHFKGNKAILGGAISLYGTTKASYSLFPERGFTNLTSCTVEENCATVGSAVGSALWNTNRYGIGGGYPLKFYIENCTITKNQIIFTEDHKVNGTGAFYFQGIPLLLNNTEFTLNNGSALVLDNVIIHVFGNVLFKKNRGRKGGAIALYGRSKLIIATRANLTFDANSCSENGGAIYVRTAGPPLIAFKTTSLNLHACFISSDQPGFFPNKWDFNVSFINNNGPTNSSGHSVFATTLQFCRRSKEGRINNTALQWKGFYYFLANGSKSDMKYEIVTSAVDLEVNQTEWNVTADKRFSPTLKLFDEKYNSVYGIISLTFKPEQKVTPDPPSAYYLAKDHIKSLVIKGKPYTHYSVTLSTVDSQLVSQDIKNVHIKDCSPGFFSTGATCKCDLTDIGVSRCDDANQQLFLLKGYWGGYSKEKEFVTVPCPVNYCACLGNNSVLSDGECMLDIPNQCSGNRQGQLCGQCKSNFSLKVGDNECVDDCNSGFSWIGYLIGLVLFLTILVLVILLINFDPFSAYLNAWLYSYQVILLLLPDRVTLDPFLLFIIGLANVRIIGFGGVCMWPGMDDLQKLAFNYILPVYVFLCLLVLNRIALTCGNNFFTRFLTQKSMARAFCTLFVLSYSTVTNVSLYILYPVKIGDDYYVFYQGTEEYFSAYHARFAIVAIILLFFVGILFPLVLIQRQWFVFIDKGLTKLLLDNFQNCFRDGYRWCAGFYFVCRFIILLISTLVPPGALKVSLLQSTCCVILTVFVLCRPYADSDGLISYRVLNTSDAILLCNLCVLSSFGGAVSGLFAAHSLFTGFKVFIRMLGYIPLLFSAWLLAYVLKSRYTSSRSVLRDVN